MQTDNSSNFLILAPLSPPPSLPRNAVPSHQKAEDARRNFLSLNLLGACKARSGHDASASLTLN